MLRKDFALLVVEDEKNDQDLLRLALASCPQVRALHFASSVREAIAYLAGHGPFADRCRYPFPDLLIADLSMPGQDGFALLEFLKANPACAVVPTIVLSASDQQCDIDAAFLLGANAYHAKPAGFPALQAQLRLLLEYWTTVQIPARQTTWDGLAVHTATTLGARFPRLVPRLYPPPPPPPPA